MYTYFIVRVDGRNVQTIPNNVQQALFVFAYGMATISKLLKIIGLFCGIKSLLQGSFAKETYILRNLLIVASP